VNGNTDRYLGPEPRIQILAIKRSTLRVFEVFDFRIGNFTSTQHNDMLDSVFVSIDPQQSSRNKEEIGIYLARNFLPRSLGAMPHKHRRAISLSKFILAMEVNLLDPLDLLSRLYYNIEMLTKKECRTKLR
jgi:hypothetical protein